MAKKDFYDRPNEMESGKDVPKDKVVTTPLPFRYICHY